MLPDSLHLLDNYTRFRRLLKAYFFDLRLQLAYVTFCSSALCINLLTYLLITLVDEILGLEVVLVLVSTRSISARFMTKIFQIQFHLRLRGDLNGGRSQSAEVVVGRERGPWQSHAATITQVSH